jgi:hypothetical protein
MTKKNWVVYLVGIKCRKLLFYNVRFFFGKGNGFCCYLFLDLMFAGRLTKVDERNIFSKRCLSCFLFSLSFHFAAKI